MELTDSKRGIISESIMCGLIGALVSAILVLIFAVICKYVNISDTVIKIVNIFIKGISVFVGIFTQIKTGEKGLIKGLLGGLIYAIVSVSLYFCLGGSFDWLTILLDLAIGLVIGGMSGILAVNTKRSLK
ncbi:MAG: TIGR04086 family membrane protein [Clostridia bacterium]